MLSRVIARHCVRRDLAADETRREYENEVVDHGCAHCGTVFYGLRSAEYNVNRFHLISNFAFKISRLTDLGSLNVR